MKKGLYNDAHKDEEEPTDTEKDDDKMMAMKRKKKKATMKDPDGQDPVDVDPKMDDVKEAAGSRAIDKKDGDIKPIKQGASDLHNCAEKVMHENWGEGLCMFGEHAEPDQNGQVAWYDVMFEHGIEREVSINDLKVISEKNHGSAMHSKRKKNDK